MATQVSLKKIVMALAVAGVSAGTVQAATVTADASANVLAPLAITISGPALSFGDVSADSTAPSTVTIDAATGAATASGAWAANNGSAGGFRVLGGASAGYVITLPSAPVTLTSGANTVSVDSFTHNATGTLDASGVEVFGVGATLTLGADQPAGLYTGTYDVTAAYQ